MPPYNLTGMDLVQDRIPDLLRTPHGTRSDSTHKLGFSQTLGYWSRFERDARRNFLSVRWNDTVLDYAPDQRDHTECHIKNEQLVCGDEHSVAARFGQNVGHVMTSVIRCCIRSDISFSDYKAAEPDSEFPNVPDIAVIDKAGKVKLVGEVKTPWMHDIEKQLQTSPHRFRRYLGQIAVYMRQTRRKYGFLTTYEQTMFLKQEEHPTKKGRWVLWHSPVIMHSTPSWPVDSMRDQGHGDGDLASPVRYRNRVSLRECFLYFIGLARAGATAVNSMPVNAWVGGQNFKYDVYDYVSDESTGCSSEEPKSSARRKATSARKPQKQNQPSSSIADLESRASRLTLGNHQPSSHRDLPWRRGADVTVHFSDSQQRWYYEDKKGHWIHVRLYEEEYPDGSSDVYFIHGNQRQRAQRDRGKRRAH